MDESSRGDCIAPQVATIGDKLSTLGIPSQHRGVSDFDVSNQANVNWIYELPFGKRRRFVSSASPWMNAVFNGWQLNGLFRWTSGLPFMVANGNLWPANWDIDGFEIFQARVRGDGYSKFPLDSPNFFGRLIA